MLHWLGDIVSERYWSIFLVADESKIATNSTDVIQLLKTLQELLQNAIQKKRPTRLWESVYTISGPLTWKDFHLLAGRGW